MVHAGSAAKAPQALGPEPLTEASLSLFQAFAGSLLAVIVDTCAIFVATSWDSCSLIQPSIERAVFVSLYTYNCGTVQSLVVRIGVFDPSGQDSHVHTNERRCKVKWNSKLLVALPGDGLSASSYCLLLTMATLNIRSAGKENQAQYSYSTW